MPRPNILRETPSTTSRTALAWLTDRARPANDICVSFNPIDEHTIVPRSQCNVTTATFRKNGIPAVAVWQSDHISIDLEPVVGNLRISHGPSSELANPIVIDPIRGTVYKLNNAKHDTTFWSKGSFVVSIPVPDYPVVITDMAYLME